ncbi:M-phase phosphoprotein 9 [Suncus etruscus]|uniref:M-phase phosphoprotein 9 n=1 Tax=Suncus etruscus TaxID=109475 RepID=UPI00211033BC|nr:M-phase phosphoprotein 9 [Suncus etruscus]
MSLNTNRSSPHLSTNGVSSFPGKTRPSVIEGTVEVLTSLMQELQNCGETDSALWTNCEARWLQLFQAVEKQCEEQVVAQQEQFHTQIQHIQEEIKSLVKLQANNASWAACDSSLSKQRPAGSPMGFSPEPPERNEPIINYSEFPKPEMQQEAPQSHADCSADGSSVSSGYGTSCVSELNSYQAQGSGEFMEHGTVCPGRPSAPTGPAEPHATSVSSPSFDSQSPEDFAAPLSEDVSHLPAELEHSFLGKSTISEVYRGKNHGSQAVTSWAQKLKQHQPKRVHSEEACPESGHASEPANQPPEQTDFTAAACPSSFYLSKPEEAPDSWVSDSGTGLTYWRLEQPDLYHSLPRTCNKSLTLSSTDHTSDQLNAGTEMKVLSLKDIYHRKQRENRLFSERDLTSTANLSHPPEVLTLDPTVHRKPSPHPHGLRSTLEDQASLSPDSVLEPTLSSHSDLDSLSHASYVTSQLSAFPKSPPAWKASPTPTGSWEKRAFPNGSQTSSTFPSLCTATSSGTSLSTVEELQAAPGPCTLALPSPLPGTAGSGTEGGDLLFSPSRVRQSLKEKHARHIADLRAYYESEISSWRQKLEAKEICAAENWKKSNQILVDRCGQLDSALSEATSRVKTLENKNNLLEIEVSDFRDRFYAASNASKVLQERIEEMRTSNKEKDSTILRLKSRLQDLEEAFENAYKLSDDKEARLKQEKKMFQDLLLEYESLGKEHERVKETLNTTENKLLDAHTQISDLKRTISKLEAQVKQVEHENMFGLRHLKATTRPSRANTLTTSDVSRRKWLIPGAEYSIFTGQPLALQDRRAENPLEEICVPGCGSLGSPPESLAEPSKTSDAPVQKALRQLEQEQKFRHLGTQTEETSQKSMNSHLMGTSASASHSPEKCPQQRPKRLSCASQRSSSLPPSSRKCGAPAKRDIMLTPVTTTSSPKRSPKENFSPGFSHLLSKSENSSSRFDILLDDLDSVPAAPSPHANPRKRLQFLPLADAEAEKQCSDPATHIPARDHSNSPRPLQGSVEPGSLDPPGDSQPAANSGQAPPDDFEYMAKIRTLAETERFFDELSKEKDQIEAALSRMPSPGGRSTLQTRLNQEALEDRLERINRELGSVRMTLKKFHVLRTCANL